LLIFIIPLFNHGDLSLNFKNGHDVKSYLELISHPILLQFLLGVFIGNIIPKLRLNDSLIKLGVFLTTILFCLYYFNLFEFLLAELIISGLLVFFIILLDLSNIKFKKSRLLIYFGDISYSIYLVHPILIILLPSLFTKIGLAQLVETKLFFLIILIFTILSSVILYNLIEKRLTSYLRKTFLN
jgi:peptidoglycan/LPS O-acetylase OafA/YrhL